MPTSLETTTRPPKSSAQRVEGSVGSKRASMNVFGSVMSPMLGKLIVGPETHMSPMRVKPLWQTKSQARPPSQNGCELPGGAHCVQLGPHAMVLVVLAQVL